LWEQLVLLLRKPIYIPGLFLALLRGKFAFKEYCRKYAGIPLPASLPYNQDVILMIRQARQQGARIVLATAAHSDIANAVAESTGLFDHVLGSGQGINLSGNAKAMAMHQDAGSIAFDYIGNDWVDLPVWQAAGRGIIACPPAKLLKHAQMILPQVITIGAEKKAAMFWHILFKQMRVYQWIKNILILIPMLLAHKAGTDLLIKAFLAILAFSASASAVYVLNDMLDLESDRMHPRKRDRPMASGRFPVAGALFLIPALLIIAGLISACFLPWIFSICLLLYLVFTTAYSLWLKKIAMLDVIILAGLYTFRLIAGGAATATPLSPWLLGFSMFMFLSLAVVKRYAEVLTLGQRGEQSIRGRGYQMEDNMLLLALGMGAALVSVLVLALYMNSNEIITYYPHHQVLWLLCPVFLLWLMRVWLVAHRGGMHDDPILFMARDKLSYLVLSSIIILVLAASF
jgi:4-hydroxybenzoate polyprenyltransferase